MSYSRYFFSVGVFLFVTGCATTDNLYSHDSSYTEAMYMYLKNDPDIEKQKDLMNEYFDSAESSGKKVAPGAYAHYGLLCSKEGNDAETLKYFELEKKNFPEASHYIDFLLNNKINKK
ncbi:MAG: DUF4810 domain-containing protein [Succinivibrionaceae bacterium]